MSLSDVLQQADGACRSRWEQLSLGYTDSTGLPALREEVSSTYTSIPASNIFVLAPAEGIYLTLKALLQPGDHVVVTYPGYQTLHEVARSIGCKLSFWQPELTQQRIWEFKVQQLEALVQSDTKAIIVNFPHNPTGALLQRSEWQRLCACCQTHGVYLFSDEMYRGLEHDREAKLPAAADSYEKGISLCGVSKALSMPGLRIGWVAMQDTALLQRIMQLRDYTTICCSAPSEVLALMGLQQQEAILQRNMDCIESNLAHLRDFFRARTDQFEWHEPAGGSVAFVGLTSGESADSFCERCVREAGVLLLPGSQFDHEPSDNFSNLFRIGYGRHNLPQCMKQLGSWLDG